MPEYFFSVGLELLDPELGLEIPQSHTDWRGVTHALAPFFRDTHQRQWMKSRSPKDLSHSRSQDHRQLTASSALNASLAAPSLTIASSPADKRLDKISIESMDMTRVGQKDDKSMKSTNGENNHVSKGIGTAISGLQTKGNYVPLDQQTTDSVWGIVHLYRDAQETPGLYGDSPLSKPPDPWLHGLTKDSIGPKYAPPPDQDCTTLCILAVPSYMAPSDFLGFVGEDTRNEVSHFRMIKTARANRYMVLMKFRNGKKAREWQQDWNGKVFNSMEVRK
jgi:BRCA1-associated protein